MTTKPKTIILEGVTGSTAYGLTTPSSDIDIKGIYVAPLSAVLGLDGPEVVSKTVDHTAPDWSYHEVGKFLKLALKCNPTTLELLWLTDYNVLTDDAKKLISHRWYFLSEPAVRGAYGAYAKAQAERLLRRTEEGKEGFSSDVKARTEKHARHCMRLLLQGTDLLTTGHMTVNVGEYRYWLFEMGRIAGRDPQKFYQQYKINADKFDAIDSVLPHTPNREKINELLIDFRLKVDAE